MINHLFVPEANFYTHPWAIDHGRGKCMACGSDWYPPIYEHQPPVQFVQFVNRSNQDTMRKGNFSCLRQTNATRMVQGICGDPRFESNVTFPENRNLLMYPSGDLGQVGQDAVWFVETKQGLCMDATVAENAMVDLKPKIGGRCSVSWIFKLVDYYGRFWTVRPKTNSTLCITVDWSNAQATPTLTSCYRPDMDEATRVKLVQIQWIDTKCISYGHSPFC